MDEETNCCQGDQTPKKRANVLSFFTENAQTIIIVLGVVAGIAFGFILKAAKGNWTPREISYVSLPGDLFLSMLKGLTLPLIVASLVSAVGSMDIRLMGRIGRKTIIYYLSTTVMAVALGILLSMTIRPGKRTGEGARNETESEMQDFDQVLTEDSIMDIFRQLFPPNLVQATMETYRTKLDLPDGQNYTFPLKDYEMRGEFVFGMNIMGLMVFSVALGVALAILGPRAQNLLSLMQGLSEATMLVTGWVIWLSPVGVCFLLAAEVLRVEDFGKAVVSLGLYLGTTVLGFVIHSFVTLPLIYFVIVRKLPFQFMANMGPAIIMAAGTASSLATLPVTLKCLEGPNKIDRRVSRFMLPVGATMNMDGMALYEAAAVLFIAQLHGVDLTLGRVIAISITATLASVGAASIPQSGLVMMVMVLGVVNLPPSYISYILPVDWILDRLLTSVNVLGDSIGAGVIDHVSKKELASLDDEDKVEERIP